MLFVLSSLGAKRCPVDMKACSEGCSHGGNFDGKRYIGWPVFTKSKFYSSSRLKNVIKEQKTKLKKSGSDGERGETSQTNFSNLLSLDGGGIKGLITVQMIQEIQKRLKRPFIDYFDWVSGTSTGSILAIALIIGKSCSQIRSIYFRFKDTVMSGSRPYSSEKIEQLLKEEVGENLKMDDLYTKYGKFVLIPTTLVDRYPVQMHLFRSYPPPLRLINRQCLNHQQENQFAPMPEPKHQLVWQALRSSCAAPTYFTTYGRCVDGGLLSVYALYLATNLFWQNPQRF